MTSNNSYRRIGLIVPSSNVTMETEIPALLRAREAIFSDRFYFSCLKNAHEECIQRRVGTHG